MKDGMWWAVLGLQLVSVYGLGSAILLVLGGDYDAATFWLGLSALILWIGRDER